MENNIYIIALAAILILILIYYINNSRNQKKQLKAKIRSSWGQVPGQEYTFEEFQNISHYFNDLKDDSFALDDITWNDLDLDSVYLLLNHTYSSIGEEYLYYVLRTPQTEEAVLKERGRLAELFTKDADLRFAIQEKFAALGRAKRFSISGYVNRLTDLNNSSNRIHFIHLGLLLFSIIAFFVSPSIGIGLLLMTIGINVVQYYRYKSRVEPYFVCVKQIVRMIRCAEMIQKLPGEGIADYAADLKGACKPLAPLLNKSKGLVSGSGMKESPLDIFAEYIRMVTHMDLISFNSILSIVQEHIAEVRLLMETLGKLETGLAIASFRACMGYSCVPVFSKERIGLMVENAYHPLIDEPVPSSIQAGRGILLTGSNASGKSTFLKTIAINAILAQTVYTVLADAYEAPFFRMYSSMALRDNLTGKESYYIVEIKSLKRILDAVKKESCQVLCFVDEVLRGTNTVERIAASSKILELLNREGALTFAATHDIELTHLLEEYYDNYHFREEVADGDIVFNYQLYKGRATTRNAIKLLSIMGYSEDLIDEAEETASRFITEGVWRL